MPDRLQSLVTLKARPPTVPPGLVPRARLAEALDRAVRRPITLVSAGHEMMRSAALLADAAREIEKDNDTVLRTPHAANGQARRKTGLGDKPA